jgi:hypothetical protein
MAFFDWLFAFPYNVDTNDSLCLKVTHPMAFFDWLFVIRYVLQCKFVLQQSTGYHLLKYMDAVGAILISIYIIVNWLFMARGMLSFTY